VTHVGGFDAQQFLMPGLPSFDHNEVALLISSVEQSLKHLRQANEEAGGRDAEMLEYGRRYSELLLKLQTVFRS
jgi:hypothetical protein